MNPAPRSDAMLSYAPLRRTYRWMRLYRALLGVSAAAVCGFASWKIVPEAHSRLVMLSAQRYVMNATPPSVEAYAFVLTKTDSPQSASQAGRGSMPTNETAENWDRFRDACQSPAPLGSSIIYAHSISDRHGNALVVGVQLVTGFGASEASPRLAVDVLKPGTLFSYPSPAQVVVRSFQFVNTIDGIPDSPSSLRIFTGQPDPADASHFTIDYELNGQRHTLDGYINEQDVLTIENRKDSTTTSSRQ